MKKKYFLIEKGGKITACTETEIEAQEYDLETVLGVEVSPCETEINAWNIEAEQFYSAEGICRLTVNSFPLQTALRIFGETVAAFEKAYTESETKTKIQYFGIGDTGAVNVTTVLTPLIEGSESFFRQLDNWKEETYGEIIKVTETETGYVFETEPWNAEDDCTVFALSFRGYYCENWIAETAFEFARFASKIA